MLFENGIKNNMQKQTKIKLIFAGVTLAVILIVTILIIIYFGRCDTDDEADKSDNEGNPIIEHVNFGPGDSSQLPNFTSIESLLSESDNMTLSGTKYNILGSGVCEFNEVDRTLLSSTLTLDQAIDRCKSLNGQDSGTLRDGGPCMGVGDYTSYGHKYIMCKAVRDTGGNGAISVNQPPATLFETIINTKTNNIQYYLTNRLNLNPLPATLKLDNVNDLETAIITCSDKLGCVGVVKNINKWYQITQDNISYVRDYIDGDKDDKYYILNDKIPLEDMLNRTIENITYSTIKDVKYTYGPITRYKYEAGDWNLSFEADAN